MNYSKQREAIISFLCSRKDHPTAEVIYNALREEMPNISKGTVYRNLGQLAENGIIKKLTGNDDMEHYDGNVAPHQHFVCSECGSVEDIFLDDTSLRLDEKASEIFDGNIVAHDIYFYGKCHKCIK